MELWQEILKNTFEGETGLVDFLSSRCYLALGKIKKIIEDENLNDKECFIKIEEIISVLEELGSNGGFRHDF